MIDFNFYLSKYIEEGSVLGFLEEITGFKICSVNIENKDALGVLLFLKVNGDLKVSFNLAFPDHVNIISSSEQLAEALSKHFRTKVIFFSTHDYDEREFFMIDEFGKKFAVNIQDEDEEGEPIEDLKIIDKIEFY